MGAYVSSVVTMDKDEEGGTRLRDYQNMTCERGHESPGPTPWNAECRTSARKGGRRSGGGRGQRLITRRGGRWLLSLSGFQ